MCSHTKHLHHYLLFPSNSYYNKSVPGAGFLKSNTGTGGAQKKREDIYIYIYLYIKEEIRCNVSGGKKNKGGKYIIYHCIIGISRQPNQGALSDYFLPYHPKWWKRRRNYQPAADCWAGILMVIIGFLMVYLLCLSFLLSGLISPVIGAN